MFIACYLLAIEGGTIDSSKWSVSFPNWNGMPPGAFSASNAAARDGMLSLSCQRNDAFAFPEPDSSCSCPYSTFTTGVLYSLETVTFGYFEIRARTASVNGLQSGFFLQGKAIHALMSSTDC
jgi:beta-glucanase (GH16 family)